MIPHRSHRTIFYGATFVNSLGSLTYTICLIAFMAKSGFSITDIGLVVGLSRVAPVFVNIFFGHLTDKLNPKHTVIVSDILCFLLAVALVYMWRIVDDSLIPFAVINAIRSAVMGFQSPARAKVSKGFATNHSYSANIFQVILFNLSTQGTTFFAGGLGFIFVQMLSFEYVIAFDAFTFIFSGLILLTQPYKAAESGIHCDKSSGVLEKFKLLYQYAPGAAALDLLLAATMGGLGAWNALLAGSYQDYIPLFLISYGAAVWISGALNKSPKFQRLDSSLWAALALAIMLLSMAVKINNFMLLLFLSMIRDTCYWSVYHRLSAIIQIRSPVHVFGSISSARFVQAAIMLAIGEIMVGFGSRFYNVASEGIWRTVLALSVAGIVGYINYSNRRNSVNAIQS